jgi:hypothetical protein
LARRLIGWAWPSRRWKRRLLKDTTSFSERRHFLDVEGCDPRIHAVYFCPQLYKYDSDKELVPLQGEEIGKLIAQTLAGGVNARKPWYVPSEKIPDQPVVNAPKDQFDTLVVDMPSARDASISVFEKRVS